MRHVAQWPRALAGGISSSSGHKILGNARKFSIIGLYSVWEGGLVDVLGEAGGLRWTWRWSSAKLGSRQVLALKLLVEASHYRIRRAADFDKVQKPVMMES